MLMAGTEKPYLLRCRELIEEKLYGEERHQWKQRDFDYLSELIFDATGVLLSVSTLKRIWKNDYEGTPHPSTLDALALYLGYKNWHAFKKNQQRTMQRQYTAEQRATGPGFQNAARMISEFIHRIIPVRRYRFALFLIIGLAGGALICYGFIRHFGSNANYDNILFSSKKVVTRGVPNTVIFNYDISMIDADSVLIQQSWDPRRQARLDKDKHYHSSVYYYPGFHKAKLVIDDKVVKQHNIHITTDGWLGLARYDRNAQIPIYIPRDDIIDDGRLYISPKTLQKHKVDLSRNEYHVFFYNVRDFGNIDGDNFTIETRLKNDLSEGGLTGQYVLTHVMCENGRDIIPLTIAGCVGNVSLKFIDVWVHGRENDLSAFGCDLSEWNDLRCEVENRTAKLILNGNVIYQLSYKEPAGRIIGIYYYFYGCGAVDYVKLTDAQGDIVYTDDFSTEG